MRLTPRVAVGIAVLCGALAALLVYVYLRTLQPKEPQAPVKRPDVTVVVPIVDVEPNTVLTAQKLAVAKVPAEQASRSMLTEPAELVGAVAMVKLQANKPIMRNQVIARGPGLGLAGIVPPGMRAVTVAVDPVTGVAGLLKAGDRVDVVATFEIEEGANLISKTILQDIELLALGSQTITPPETTSAEEEAAPAEGEPAKGRPSSAPTKDAETKTTKSSGSSKDSKTVQYPNATLAVTPEDAPKLMVATQRGTISLILRPIGEHDYVPVPSPDLRQVVGPAFTRLRPEPPPAPQKPAPAPAVTTPPVPVPPVAPRAASAPRPAKQPPAVEVIRGSEREKVVPGQ